jgi:hypothetical protein
MFLYDLSVLEIMKNKGYHLFAIFTLIMEAFVIYVSLSQHLFDFSMIIIHLVFLGSAIVFFLIGMEKIKPNLTLRNASVVQFIALALITFSITFSIFSTKLDDVETTLTAFILGSLLALVGVVSLLAGISKSRFKSK